MVYSTRYSVPGGPGRRKSSWSSKRGDTFRPSARSSTGRSGRGRKFRAWSRRGLLKLETLTRPLRKKRLCLSCAWRCYLTNALPTTAIIDPQFQNSTVSAAHTTSASSAKPMMLVPAGRSMRRKSSYMTFQTSGTTRDP